MNPSFHENYYRLNQYFNSYFHENNFHENNCPPSMGQAGALPKDGEWRVTWRWRLTDEVDVGRRAASLRKCEAPVLQRLWVLNRTLSECHLTCATNLGTADRSSRVSAPPVGYIQSEAFPPGLRSYAIDLGERLWLLSWEVTWIDLGLTGKVERVYILWLLKSKVTPGHICHLFCYL